jgi:penicillin-insensitive murein endopeptidase
VPHHGVLTHPAELPPRGEGYRWLTQNDRHFAVPRFVATIERAAARVARERPGSMLVVGDLSAKNGGRISHHSSHRTGRDVDLLLYVTTLDGAPVESPGFVQVGADGLAWDAQGQRFLRLDVEREWLLVKALVEDPDARVQWLFVSRPIAAMLVEWARARGEAPETIVRAMETMQQPAPPAQAHDDHVHVRTACEPGEVALGCEPSGPERKWIAAIDAERATERAADATATIELVEAILRPLDGRASGASSTTGVDGPKAAP